MAANHMNLVLTREHAALLARVMEDAERVRVQQLQMLNLADAGRAASGQPMVEPALAGEIRKEVGQLLALQLEVAEFLHGEPA